MSVIEDSRKVLQDFITPELRAIDARLTALEKRFDEVQTRTDKRFDDVYKRFDEAQTRTDKRFDQVQAQIDLRFDQILKEIRQLKTVHDLELRMANYEAMLNAKHGAESKSIGPKPESEAA